MSIVLVLIPLSIVCAAGFLAAFIWAVRSGQFEDTCTPSMRLLLDDSTKAARPKTGLRPSPTSAPANRTRPRESASSEPKSNQP